MSLARIKRLEAILQAEQALPTAMVFVLECPEGYRVDGKTFPDLGDVARAFPSENPAGLRGVVIDASPVAGAAISWRLATLFPDGRIIWGRRDKLAQTADDVSEQDNPATQPQGTRP